MKKKQINGWQGWLLGGVALLLAACSEDTMLPRQGCEEALELESVTLDETGSTATRTLLTAVDKVGIYVTKATDHTAYPSYPNSVYTLSGTTWSTASPPQITAGNGAAKVYAYSPASLAVTHNSSGNHTVPVSVVTADNFIATAQTDYLLTGKYVKGQPTGNGLQVTPLDASSTSRSLNIPLVHALAKVSLRVLKSDAATEKLTLKKVEILSPTNRIQAGNGTMNLQNGKLAGLSSTSQLTLTGETVLTTGSSTPNVTCLVAPMAGEEPLLSFRLTVTVQTEGAAGTDLTFETGVVGTPQKWEPCKHYIYKVTVDKMGGGFSGVQMDDWQNDASQNTSIGI